MISLRFTTDLRFVFSHHFACFCSMDTGHFRRNFSLFFTRMSLFENAGNTQLVCQHKSRPTGSFSPFQNPDQVVFFTIASGGAASHENQPRIFARVHRNTDLSLSFVFFIITVRQTGFNRFSPFSQPVDQQCTYSSTR